MKEPGKKSIEGGEGGERDVVSLYGREIEEVKKGTEEGGKNFSRRVKRDVRRIFKERDFFEKGRELFRGGKEVFFNKEVNTKGAKEEGEKGPEVAEEVGGNDERREKKKELSRKIGGVSHTTKETERLVFLPDREERSF